MSRFRVLLSLFMVFSTIFILWFVAIEYHEQSHIRVAQENRCVYERVSFNQVGINCDGSPFSVESVNSQNLMMEGLFYNLTIPLLVVFSLGIAIIGGKYA